MYEGNITFKVISARSTSIYVKLVPPPPPREHFSLKIDVRDQTILKYVRES